MERLGTMAARRTLRSTLIGAIIALSMLTAADAHAANSFFGVLPQETMSPSELATARAGGIESIRLPLSRTGVTTADGFDWTPIDVQVRDAAKAGLNILPTIYYTSPLENSDRRWLPNTPEGIDNWNELLESAAGRYGTDGSFWANHPSIPRMPVTVWQIWNEVNTLWFTKSIAPDDYARLVIESSKTIKAVDPNAKIMLSGLVATPRPEAGMRADNFLNELYGTTGFRSSFDFAAIHPYEVNVPDSVQAIADLRSALDRSGDRTKGIYVTELGWGSDSKTVFGKGSQANQAEFLASAYKSMILKRPELKVDAVYWFSWKDLTPDRKACVFCHETGLFDATGAPKASWRELTTIIERERTHPGDPGPFDPDPGRTSRRTSDYGMKRCRRFRGSARETPALPGRGTLPETNGSQDRKGTPHGEAEKDLHRSGRSARSPPG